MWLFTCTSWLQIPLASFSMASVKQSSILIKQTCRVTAVAQGSSHERTAGGRRRRGVPGGAGPDDGGEHRRPDTPGVDVPDVVPGPPLLLPPRLPQPVLRLQEWAVDHHPDHSAGGVAAAGPPPRPRPAGEKQVDEPGAVQRQGARADLICIFANAGAAFSFGPAYAVGVVNIVKAFYGRSISFVASWLLIITTQVYIYRWIHQ